MGLSYAALRARNPRLIMVSTGILGRKGTMGLGMSGTGMTGSAYAGATNLLGWPDRPPTGPQGPWTDEVAPRFLVSSILAALHRRNATGAGTYIDLAQAEAGLQFLSPAYLDFAVNGVAPQRQWEAGSTLRAPSGVYPCAGEDRWLAIDASEHAAWRGLVDVVGPALATAQFGTLVARLRNREALDAVISGWTTKQDAVVLEQRLQNAGVPAHVVSQDLDIFQDSDLRHEGFYRQVSDPVIGEITIAGPQFRLVGTPQVETRAGPTIGDHAEEILARLCGRTPAEIEILKRSGVLV
jgi:benzylsuccinate CoA-transferase BbsF subunit